MLCFILTIRYYLLYGNWKITNCFLLVMFAKPRSHYRFIYQQKKYLIFNGWQFTGNPTKNFQIYLWNPYKGIFAWFTTFFLLFFPFIWFYIFHEAETKENYILRIHRRYTDIKIKAFRYFPSIEIFLLENKIKSIHLMSYKV